MTKKFPVAEMFDSIQGEGLWTGTRMFFIRFAGCSVGKRMTEEERRVFGGEDFPKYRETCTLYDGRKFACFVSSTLVPVVSDDRYIRKVPVGSLKVGDRVMAWTKEGTVASKVLRLEKRYVPEEELVTVHFQKPLGGEHSLLVTKDHRFLNVDYKWAFVEKLTLGTKLHHASRQVCDETRKLLSDVRKQGIRDGRITFQKLTPKARKAISNRMVLNNPMYDSDSVARMLKSHWRRPTGPEKKIIEIAADLGLGLKYTGANGKLVKSALGKIRNPDFVLTGTQKVVEVYDSSFHYMGKKRDSRWVSDTKRWYSQCGYDCLVLDVHRQKKVELARDLVKFSGNGLVVSRMQYGIGRGFSKKFFLHPGTVKIENGKKLFEVTELETEHGNYLGPAGVVSHNCDTNFQTTQALTMEEILEQVPKGVERLCFTGGEPLNQPLGDFIDHIGARTDYKLHVETSGTVSYEDVYPEYSPMDNSGDEEDGAWVWLAVSPKKDVLPEMIGIANEIKLLVDADFDIKKVPVDILDHRLVWLQPINDEFKVDQENVQRCIKLMKEYPNFRLSTQAHKIWNVR